MSQRFVPLALLLLAFACTSNPTLPLPPPNALVEAPPDDRGLVRVRVSAALPGAFVNCLNERTGRGVIGTADDRGRAVLELEAQVGDRLAVWQRVDTQSGELTVVVVPGSEGDAGSEPALDAGPDGGGG